jgi:hypothetical protein
MQRIWISPWTAEEYQERCAYQWIVPDLFCANCRRATKLHHHGHYCRYVLTLTATYLLIVVLRFLCPLCGKTISYLPNFTATYRAMQWETFQAFLDGQVERVDVRKMLERLRHYRQQAEEFAAELFRTVGAGLGRAPPRTARGLWGWVKKAGDGLRSVTRRLVTDFKMTLFKRYRCHQPVGRPRRVRPGAAVVKMP